MKERILLILLIGLLVLINANAKADGLYLDLGITNSGSLFRADLDFESEEEAGAIINVRYHWVRPFKGMSVDKILLKPDSADCGWFHDSQWFYGFPADDRTNEFDRDKAGCYLSWKVWD